MQPIKKSCHWRNAMIKYLSFSRKSLLSTLQRRKSPSTRTAMRGVGVSARTPQLEKQLKPGAERLLRGFQQSQVLTVLTSIKVFDLPVIRRNLAKRRIQCEINFWDCRYYSVLLHIEQKRDLLIYFVFHNVVYIYETAATVGQNHVLLDKTNNALRLTSKDTKKRRLPMFLRS